MDLQEKKLDIEELKLCQQLAKREYVKKALDKVLATAEKELNALEKAEQDKKIEERKKKESAPVPSSSELKFTPISSWAWDQTKSYVNLYITLTGNFSQQDVSVNFETRKFDLQVKIEKKNT